MCTRSSCGNEEYKGALLYKGVDVQFVLTANEIRWWPENFSQEDGVKIPVADILSVTSSEDAGDDGILRIRYVERCKWDTLKQAAAEFKGSMTICGACAERLQQHISEVDGRPRRVLVLVSPVSGLCKGRQIYKTQVEPVFQEAGVHIDVKETERSGHATEIVAQYDLSTVDSVVVVGGDGTYNEIVNGMLKNPRFSKGDEVTEPPDIDVPIGIVPTGTGNIIAARCCGNTNPETAALAIVIGRRRRTGLFGIYSDGKLLTYAAFSVAYGFFSDLMALLASRRYRNVFLTIPTFMWTMTEFFLFREIRETDLTVQYRQQTKFESGSGSPSQGVSTEKEISTTASSLDMNTKPYSAETCCNTSVNEKTKEDDYPIPTNGADTDNGCGRSSWTSTSTLYTGVVAMFAFDVFTLDKISDGMQVDRAATRVVLYKPTSRWQFLKSMYHAMVMDCDSLGKDENIEHAVVTEYNVRVNNPHDSNTDTGQKELLLNVDGEVVPLSAPEFSVRVFDKKVTLFCNV